MAGAAEHSSAKIVSVNVGQPRVVETLRAQVLTAIWKTPVEGRIAVRGHNLAGDRQADLTVHGGPYKAVYLYPQEHYDYWRNELGLEQLEYGAFGENLTTLGLLEEQVQIGDELRFGTAVLRVTQPRMPCFKLALRFNRSDMVKRFWASGRSGIYFSVVKEGDLAAGDSIVSVRRGPEEVSVADVVRLFKGEEWNREVLERALRSPLYGGWKQQLQSRLVEA